MHAIQSKFREGDEILYRERNEKSCIVDAKPVVVVEDSDSRIALWLPLGTPTIRSVLLNHTPGTPRRWEDGNWALVDGIWKWAEILILIRPDEFRATWVRWSDERVFQGWYVNMQSQLTRTRLGFDFSDHQLDILVEPNRNWQWKDQDELDICVDMGRTSPAQAEAIRAEGQLAIGEIERDGAPFSDGWEHWRPNKTMTHPTLPPDWDDLSMYKC